MSNEQCKYFSLFWFLKVITYEFWSTNLEFDFLALNLITLSIGQNVVSDNPVVGKLLFQILDEFSKGKVKKPEKNR